jgi:gliding motility-associated transport system permease protein/gliding motility-associatede transport system auxiliary component
MLNRVVRIARKEVATFFSSPIAFIFLGAFLAVTLFVFFWVETFFARNIADVRPLFDWMPVLLIFLVAALTMRMWSEEKRMGTLEFLLTQPVTPLQLVLGKFLACLALVGIALILTVPVPITVSLVGNLDWGTVIGAYIATMFLAAAYISIGLTVSAKSDNQIVSLIVSVLVCTFFYTLGTETLTSLFGVEGGKFLKSLGTGSRFASITRGVIDLRDLYYYLSIVGVFLSLNVYFLESGRWAGGVQSPAHKHWRLLTGLLAANFIIGNVWLSQVNWARADITEGNIYSISDATKGYLDQLQEPLLIRGYFSAKTHPLLAPLVPQLRDLILEYEVAGNGKVRAEFVDPLENPELEVEAGQKYGIKPVPFQVADKYQASLVNSYFDVLIQYGDQYQVLGFRDLIEIKAQTEAELDVELRDPEYEITRSIKKVLYEYQSGGELLANMDQSVRFTGYISPDKKMPELLVDFKKEIVSVLSEMKDKAGNKFEYELKDPNADSGTVAKEIAERYGFRPMRAGLLDPNTFYFYMIVRSGDEEVQVPLPEDLEKESFRRSLEAAVKRFSSGFMKSIAVYTPPRKAPEISMQQFRMPSGKEFRILQDLLKENHNTEPASLETGFVPDNTDLLLVVAPEEIDDKQLFAADQFLMKGGTVVLSTAPFEATIEGGSLAVARHESGLKEWLEHNGIRIEESMVLDPQNAMLPVPISRDVGGFTVQEIRMVEYPYFVDIRADGMEQGSAITASIPQVMMNWASPISVDAEKNKGRTVTHLLESSEGSWLSGSTDILPDFERYGPLGFEPADTRKRYPLAVVVEGKFESFFKEIGPPMLNPEDEDEHRHDDSSKSSEQEEDPVISTMIEKSPDAARIIVFASNDFVSDQTLQLAASAGGTEYLNSLNLIENAIDWSLEDRGLLSIRSRSHFSRTLRPLSSQAQVFWEYLNYGFALVGLFLVYIIHRRSRLKAEQHYREVLQQRRNDR